MRVEVVALREDVYFGNLVVESGGRILNIDSRPSDALALAIRGHVPVFVSREVMESAGIVPEQDLADETPPATLAKSTKPAPVEPEAQERLSVFEDFLSNLNIGDLNNPEDEEDNSDEEKPDPDKGK